MGRLPTKTIDRRTLGSIQGWLLFSLIFGVALVLLVVFVNNLPDPPRYDDLTIEPGSAVPPRAPFGMRLEIGEGEAMVSRSWRTSELEVDGRPAIPELLARTMTLGDSWRLVAALNVELAEPTIVGLLLEVRDVEFVVRSAVSEIASDRIEAIELRRIDDFLVPAGSRTLEFDLAPIGPDPIFRGFWIDESGDQRPFSELAGYTPEETP